MNKKVESKSLQAGSNRDLTRTSDQASPGAKGRVHRNRRQMKSFRCFVACSTVQASQAAVGDRLQYHHSLLGILVAPSSRIHSPFNITFSTQCLTIAAKSVPFPGLFGNSNTLSSDFRTFSLICAVIFDSK